MKPVFEYYIIENMTVYSSYTSCLFASLQAAEKRLSEFVNWWLSTGTANIYHVWYTHDNDIVVEHKDFVKRVCYRCGKYVKEEGDK